MVVLITLFQSTEDRDGTQLVRLIDHDGLEAALQGLVLLKVFLVFVQRGGTDRAQLTTCQCRFQDIGGIHGTLTTTGTYQRVDLIDEEDDASLTLRHLVDDTLQALLELTLVFRTSHQGTHIQGEELLVFQVLRYVATDDTLGKSLYYCRLTCTWLTNQYRVVLRTTGEDLQHPADLIITSDDRVELPLSGKVHQVLGIFLQRLVVVVSRLRLHLLSLSQLMDSGTQVFLRDTRILQDPSCRGSIRQQGE